MKVAIDAGHGMGNRRRGLYDPGAVVKVGEVTYEEASIALTYALELGRVLERRGHAVLPVRPDGRQDRPIARRPVWAKDAGGDVYVSVHVNAAAGPAANGTETLYRDAAGRGLAEALQRAVVWATGFVDRGVKLRSDLVVLKFDGPAALLELGFLTHAGNRAALCNRVMCSSVALALAEALEMWKGCSR